MNDRFHIAVFASGAGSTLQTLIDNQLPHGYHVALMVANRPCMALEQHQVQLIVLAGFLAIIPEWICQKWAQRIINIHPSLLPKYAGKGMYGIHVQEALLAANDTIAGCTIHYVNAEVDGGSIIAQATVPVLPNDTPETLSQRVQEQEKQLLPRTIQTILNNISPH